MFLSPTVGSQTDQQGTKGDDQGTRTTCPCLALSDVFSKTESVIKNPFCFASWGRLQSWPATPRDHDTSRGLRHFHFSDLPGKLVFFSVKLVVSSFLHLFLKYIYLPEIAR